MLSGKEIERGKNGGDTIDMEGVRNSAESSVHLIKHIAVDVSQLVDGVMEHVVLIFEVVGVPISFDLSISRILLSLDLFYLFETLRAVHCVPLAHS
jgi:hypothetical protein